MEQHSSSKHDADSRKKRDSRAVKGSRTEKHDTANNNHDDDKDSSSAVEKSKKLRASEEVSEEKTKDHREERAIENSSSSAAGIKPQPVGAPLDLEVALQRVVRMNNSSTTSNGNDPEKYQEEASKEFLSPDCWVNFRMGHAGDASFLASFYQKSKRKDGESTKKTSEEDTTLEVRLAEGLGDEDTPPAIFALIAEVAFEDEPDRLGAAALLSITWEESRVLQVEWQHVEKQDTKLAAVANLLERRLWLRLSTLALMCSCTMLVAPNCNTEAAKQVESPKVTLVTADQQRGDTSSDRS